MARETDYTVVYRAAADFSALSREAAKARAILKAMREEEEKANKVSLQDQDKLEKARTRARKALEAQNMAATTSARISREMADRGKREAETVRELAKGSETAARQINKLAEAYKKLNSAASGETSSNSARSITERSNFAAVSARELEKVKNNLTAYINSAREAGDTNTRLTGSFKNIKDVTSQAGDILSRLTAETKKQSESITEVSVSTKQYGNVIETTTRRITNAGTEAEKVVTTVRRVTREVETASTRVGAWVGNLARNFRSAWREAEEGVSVLGKLRNAASGGGGGGNGLDRLTNSAEAFGRAGTRVLAIFARLPRVIQAAIGIATIFEPAVAVLGSLGAAALGAANNLASLSGVVAALPGMFAAGATAVGALMVALGPVSGVFKQYSAAQKEAETTSNSAGRAQRDNSQQIATALRAQRNAQESLADANRGLRRAQEDLNQAWRDAKKDLEDLREEVNRGKDDQEGAEIALARAKERQAEINKDLLSSDLDRREAAHAVREAENALADVRKRNKENKEELDATEKRGLKNSEQVIRAQENLANAQRQVRNAELDLIDSKKRLADAHKVEMTGAAAATTQQDRYKKMLEALSPSTRKFVEQILGMEGAWKKVQRATGESFFKHLINDQARFNALIPIGNQLLTRAADALGKVADRGLAMITSGPWKSDFAKLSKDNAVLIENMGDAGLSVADAFRHITMAAAPFTRWVTAALKEGAENFAEWGKRARSDGSIAKFLDETKARMQQMWQITKNVLATLNSWNTASSDFGKWMLDRLEAMTKRWRENAKAQEENGSKLKKYLEDVRPVLVAVGALVGAVARGFANIASDPENMASTIKLLQTLQNNVLPPLLSFLDELNDSGIAITVAEALGRIFEAFEKFLEAGGGDAISTFVSTFATVVDLILDVAEATGVLPVLAGLVTGLAAIAGAALAAKFLGLFMLVDVFKWVLNNGRAVGARFRDIGDGINSTTTSTSGPGNVPPGAGGGTYPPPGGYQRVTKPSPISASELAAVQKNVQNYTVAAQGATAQSGRFSRALDGVRSASGGMRRGLGSVTDFLGGPWGIALTAAAIGLAYFASQQDKVKAKADGYVAALQGMALGNENAAGAMKVLSAEALRSNPELVEMTNQMKELGFSADEIKAAFNGSSDEVSSAIDRINKAIKETENSKIDPSLLGPFIGDRTFNKDAVERIEKLKALKKALEENKITNEQAARAIQELGLEQRKASVETERHAEVVRNSTFDMAIAGEQIKTLDDVLNVLGSSTSTTAQRFEALKTAADLMRTEADKNATANEKWAETLVSLDESVAANGKSLDIHSREGLNNRAAIREATIAARDHTLELLASNVPYDVAIKKHQERIAELKKEAKEAGLDKEATAKLIAEYDKVPGEVKTEIEAKGFEKVYQQLRELQWAQVALKFGMSPEDAAAEWKRMEAARKGNYPQGSGSAGLTQKRAMGGPIYGPGHKTSDDIDAKLSTGEFVHKADAVSYYGQDLMYDINNQLIDKSALKAARQVSSRKDRSERFDPEFSVGGLVQKLANGGPVLKAPFDVGLQYVLPAAKKLYSKWKTENMAIGGGGDASIGGWKNMWNWVKTRFPYTSLMSGYRPGDPLYHGKGKAIDIGVPDKFGTGRWWNVFNGIKSTFFKNIAELIWDFAGNKAVWNGREHFFKGPKSGPGTHRDHIHFAMKNPSANFTPGQRDNADKMKFAGGGLVDYLNFGGLPTSVPASVPSGTSTLSRAARSVVNQNTTNSGLSIGELTINNPVPERGGDSIRSSLLRTAMIFDGP